MLQQKLDYLNIMVKMNKQIIAIVLTFILFSCAEEEPIHWEELDLNKATEISSPIGKGQWTEVFSDFTGEVYDLAVFNEKLFLAYRGPNQILSAEYSEIGTKNHYASSSISSYFNKLKVINNSLYALGAAGDYAVAKFDTTNGYWTDAYYVNNNLNDLLISNERVIIAKASAPYVQFNDETTSGWEELGNEFDHSVNCLLEYNNEIIAAGNFTTIGNEEMKYIAKWNGTKWVPMGNELNNRVNCLFEYDGKLLAGGSFKGGVAEWTGREWIPFNNGLEINSGGVTEMIEHSGQLIIGGDFMGSFSITSPYVIKWTGSKWMSVAGGAPDIVDNLAVYKNELYITNTYSYYPKRNFLLRLEE